MILGIGLGGDGLRYTLEDDTLENLRLTEDDIETVLAAMTEFVSSSLMSGG